MKLKNVGYIPDFAMNLFSITTALRKGVLLGNEGENITLTQGETKLVFDEPLNSENVYVTGKTMLGIPERF